MGANPWWYVVDYEADVGDALQSLRRCEFEAGRYFPAIDYDKLIVIYFFQTDPLTARVSSSILCNLNADQLTFPITPDYPPPGAQHASIEDAIEDADADGTQSILDIREVSETRSPGTISPLEPSELLNVFGTETPSSEILGEEIPNEIFDFIDRGQAIYVVFYNNNQPDKFLFVGYSYD